MNDASWVWKVGTGLVIVLYGIIGWVAADLLTDVRSMRLQLSLLTTEVAVIKQEVLVNTAVEKVATEDRIELKLKVQHIQDQLSFWSQRYRWKEQP